MKTIYSLLCCLVLSSNLFAQEGKVVYERLYSSNLENIAGENPERRISIYLPPGYEKSGKNYPVVYYLHGFTWNDSLTFAVDGLDQLLDKAIAEGVIQPLIVIAVDNHTSFRGSFYTNSSFTGKWEDFNANDVVEFVDQNFRTLHKKESRGVAGHSMGGYGAIKFGMRFPDVFSAVYALSPALSLSPPTTHAFKRASELQSKEELTTGFAEFDANAVVAVGRTLTPNPEKLPFQADLPYEFKNSQIVVRDDVIKKWHSEQPIHMIPEYADNLRSLKAIKLDWGRNEGFPFGNANFPKDCLEFSRKLELYHIDHFAEEYNGDHVNRLWTEDGRAMMDMFPFFNRFLEFE